MDFQLNEDQEALRDGVRAFCEGRVPLEQLPALDEKGAFDAELWSDLAELGVFSLRVPEALGGVGLGNADAVLVFAELGRRLVPGPLAWSHLAADLVEGAGSGEVVVGGLDLLGPTYGPLLVEHRDHLNTLLVLDAKGVFRVDEPARLEADPIEKPLDPLTPLHRLRERPSGEQIAGPEVAEKLRLEGAALLSAQLLG
ncbi:MAG: acyl-CoA dehydrogenase family protein, partial [Myxococcota bacterium]